MRHPTENPEQPIADLLEFFRRRNAVTGLWTRDHGTSAQYPLIECLSQAVECSFPDSVA